LQHQPLLQNREASALKRPNPCLAMIREFGPANSTCASRPKDSGTKVARIDVCWTTMLCGMLAAAEWQYWLLLQLLKRMCECDDWIRVFNLNAYSTCIAWSIKFERWHIIRRGTKSQCKNLKSQCYMHLEDRLYVRYDCGTGSGFNG
jgi:hypothetical protein